MVNIRVVNESDLVEFRGFHNAQLGGDDSLVTIRNWHREHPELLMGAYDGGDLVGHCIGRQQSEDEVELCGIAVTESYRRQAIGTELLAAFEEQAVTLGARRITLESAGGYVDRFYIENGYSPESVLVRLVPDNVPREYRAMGYEIEDEQIENGTKKLSIKTEEYNPAFLEEVRDAFDDPEAAYIMAKELDTS